MLFLGCHMSCAKGFARMGRDAVAIGANTLQFFTRNPRGSKAKALDEADLQEFRALMEEAHFSAIVAHAPYTLNACSADASLRALAREMMEDDLRRLAYLPGNYYNFHPGSHMGQGTETGIEQIAALLNQLLRPDQHTTVLLETMAGKGSEVGHTFEELRAILDRVTLSEHMGVCLDTCHVFDAGYDIVGDLDGVLCEFDRVIGLKRLRAIHLNGSKNPRGSHKDRHARLGEGEIPVEALVRVIRHPRLCGLPFVLETPNELPGYAAEIALLRARFQPEEAEDSDGA